MMILTEEQIAALPYSQARAYRRKQSARRLALRPQLRAICERCEHWYEQTRHYFEDQQDERARALGLVEDPQLDLPCCELLGRKRCGGTDAVVPDHAAWLLALQSGRCPNGLWDELLNDGERMHGNSKAGRRG